MHLKTLWLQHFRCYEQISLACSPNVNVIWGENARGKTSILEAIHFLSTGKSFRTAQRSEMVRWNQELLRTRALFSSHSIDQDLDVTWGSGRSDIQHNHNKVSSLTGLSGILPSIVITPDDQLIKGSPQERRKFLDTLLAQMDPLYAHHLSRYTRAVKQRNLLLKNEQLGELDTWESIMAKAATYLVISRQKIAEALQQKSQEILPQLWGDNQQITLSYNLPAETSLDSWYQEAWKQSLQRDLATKTTSVGPHRDDMDISLNGNAAREFGSEGQKRLLVTTLRLASWHLLKEKSAENPLLLIDDLGINLDAKRRETVTAYAKQLGQVFITSTEKPSLLAEANSISVD